MPWAPRVAVVEFVAPGGAAANADKMRDGETRFDSIPIVQGLRNAGAAVDRVERMSVAAAGRAVFRVEVRVPRPARVHIKVHGAFAQNWLVYAQTADA